jgi:hypothetical protein
VQISLARGRRPCASGGFGGGAASLGRRGAEETKPNQFIVELISSRGVYDAMTLPARFPLRPDKDC